MAFCINCILGSTNNSSSITGSRCSFLSYFLILLLSTYLYIFYQEERVFWICRGLRFMMFFVIIFFLKFNLLVFFGFQISLSLWTLNLFFFLISFFCVKLLSLEVPAITYVYVISLFYPRGNGVWIWSTCLFFG